MSGKVDVYLEQASISWFRWIFYSGLKRDLAGKPVEDIMQGNGKTKEIVDLPAALDRIHEMEQEAKVLKREKQVLAVGLITAGFVLLFFSVANERVRNRPVQSPPPVTSPRVWLQEFSPVLVLDQPVFPVGHVRRYFTVSTEQPRSAVLANEGSICRGTGPVVRGVGVVKAERCYLGGQTMVGGAFGEQQG